MVSALFVEDPDCEDRGGPDATQGCARARPRESRRSRAGFCHGSGATRGSPRLPFERSGAGTSGVIGVLAEKRKQGEDSGPARSIPADVRPGEMHAAVCLAPVPHGLLRGAGQRAHPVRVLSARPGADRRRVRTGGDGQGSDDEGRSDPGDGSRPFPVDRRMRHRAGVVPQRYHAPDRTGVQIEQHQPAADELARSGKGAHLADSIGRSTGNISVGSQGNFSPTTSDGLISRNFSSITRGHPKNVSRDGVPWKCHSLPTGLTLNLSNSSACASARTFLSFDAVLATRASAILATSLYSAASFARMSSAVL